jgi:GNAT superfamily N-acetyltransferase
MRCAVTQNHQSREELAVLGSTPDTVREMIDSADFVNFVAEEHGSAVGFAIGQISQAYVCACFVRPAFDGRGVGRALIAAIEDGLRGAGVNRCGFRRVRTGPAGGWLL